MFENLYGKDLLVKATIKKKKHETLIKVLNVKIINEISLVELQNNYIFL